MRDRVLRALRLVDGNRARAAEMLGISRRTLIRRIHEYGIPLRVNQWPRLSLSPDRALQAFQLVEGNRTRAAAMLGISRRTLSRHMLKVNQWL